MTTQTITSAADLEARMGLDPLYWDTREAEHLRSQHHLAARQILDGAEAANRSTLQASEQRELGGHQSEITALDQMIQRNVDALKADHDKLERDRRAADEARNGSLRLGQRQNGYDEAPSSRLVLPSWSEYRALSEGTGSAGGYLVPTEQATVWWDLLRRQSVFLAAGPRMIEVHTDRLEVPKIGASVTAAMVAENAQISPSDPTFEQVVLTPKKLAALTLVSNESLEDSNPSLREVVQADHIGTMSSLLDSQFLAGSGSGANMTGLRNMASITVTPTATNGRAPTLADVADAISRLEADNATAKLAVFMHSRTWNTYRQLVDSQSRYQLNPDPTGDARRQLFGVPVFISNALSITETRGSSTDCSWIGVADMDRIAVGRRKQIQVDYSADYKFDYDQTAIRSLSRWDIGLLDEEAVEIISGVRA